MDKTLHDLGGILLSGLPTFFLVLILAFFVKTLYVAPLKKVLAERHRLTEGAKKAAEDSFRNAESKVAEYEEALNRARGEIYQEQAEFLRQIHAEQAERTRTSASLPPRQSWRQRQKRRDAVWRRRPKLWPDR